MERPQTAMILNKRNSLEKKPRKKKRKIMLPIFTDIAMFKSPKNQDTIKKDEGTTITEESEKKQELSSQASFGNKEILRLLKRNKKKSGKLSARITKHSSTKDIKGVRKAFQKDIDQKKEKNILMVTSKSIHPLSPSKISLLILIDKSEISNLTKVDYYIKFNTLEKQET